MRRDFLSQYYKRPESIVDEWYLAYIGMTDNFTHFQGYLKQNKIKADMWIPAYESKKIIPHNIRKIFKPIFPGYVFVHFPDLDNKHAGFSFLHDGSFRLLGAPTSLKKEEIDSIENFMIPKSVKEDFYHNIEVDDLVRVVSGPMKDFVGVVQYKKKSQVLFDLEMGLRTIRVEIDVDNVEKIA